VASAHRAIGDALSVFDRDLAPSDITIRGGKGGGNDVGSLSKSGGWRRVFILVNLTV